MKYIVITVFCIILFASAYYIFNSNTSNSSDSRPDNTNKCKYGIDKDGKCIVPELCGNVAKPLKTCDDNQELVCDKDFSNPQWRCKLKCESDSNKFPHNFSNCDVSQIKCDSNGRYYCDNDYCKNGGILYSGNSKCSCDPNKFIGDKCECSISKCQGGIADSSTCKCTSCCNDSTSASFGKSKLCKNYGDNCENKCDLDNYFYDDTQKICVCPDGYIEDSDKRCNLINCGKNGTLVGNKCVCTEGFTGDRCNIAMCGNNGTWNTLTKKCDCNLDQSGNPLASGDRCQYSRQGFCNGNGYPVVNNGVPTCVCDPDAGGEHCTCKISGKPTKQQSDTCKGKVAVCQETNAMNDDNRQGSWIPSYLPCNDIYSTFGGMDEWIKSCTSVITEDQNKSYPQYKAYCEPLPQPNTDDLINKFYYNKTCDATPDEQDLVKCRQGLDKNGKALPNPPPSGGCYVSSDYKPGDNSFTSKNNSYCICDTDLNGDVDYYCKPISDVNDCGPMPPKGFCNVGGTNVSPICVSYEDGNNYTYVCPSSTLPQDYLSNYYKLTLSQDDKWWYSNKEQTTVFPTIDMDQCIDYNENGVTKDINMYTSLNDNTGYQPGYKGLNPLSKDGFVSGLKTDTPVFHERNDPAIYIYNYRNPIINSDGTKISDGVNAYPSYNNSIQDSGCASFRKKYDPSKGDIQSSCALNSDNSSRGDFRQLCSLKDGTIQKDYQGNYICDKDSYYTTNTGKCDCLPYHSYAQNKDYAHYKGKFCQYDDTMCNSQGIIDDNGVCNCILYDSNSQNKKVNYKGDKCQYNDNDKCGGLGIVDNNGDCDFKTILNDIGNYVIANPLSLKSGDIIIIEYVVAGPPDSTSNGQPVIIPQNKFISSELSVSPLTVYNIPTPFEVRILPNNNFQFEILNKDAKDINFYLYNNSSLYLNTDSNDYTQLSWPASTYSFLPNPYFLDSYNIVTEGNEILCDYASSSLLKGNDIWHQTLWRIHKLNKVLPRI